MTIIHGDCLAWTGGHDVMIADPPYSAHVHKNATSSSNVGGTRHNDLGFAPLTVELRNAIALFAATSKRWSLIYSDVEGLTEWKETCEIARAKYIRAMPWVRWSSPQLSGDRPPQGFELVTAYWGLATGRKSWNGPGNLTHLDHKCLRGAGKHKTEKPFDQVLDLVEWFSNEGELVFDPCAGSGGVGLACKLLNRKYVGYEIDAEWAMKAEHRIATPLSERDIERYARWLERKRQRTADMERMAANTARQRYGTKRTNYRGTEQSPGTGEVGEGPIAPGGAGSIEGEAASAEEGPGATASSDSVSAG